MNARLIVVVAAMAAILSATAQANPGLFVSYQGPSAWGNNEWLVSVSPDPAYFSQTLEGFGSSLAVELAFAVTGSTVMEVADYDVNWPYDNPGHNPFSNSVTFGTWTNPTNNHVFTAYGSGIFTTGDPVPLFLLTTVGTGPTMISYGVAAAEGQPRNGSVIAQAGENFPVGGAGGGSSDYHEFIGYSGSVSSFPTPPILAGDYNNDHVVNTADYVVWRRSLQHDTPLQNETASWHVVDQADYDAWRANFGAVQSGNGSTSVSFGTSGGALPEPATCWLVIWAGVAIGLRPYRFASTSRS